MIYGKKTKRNLHANLNCATNSKDKNFQNQQVHQDGTVSRFILIVKLIVRRYNQVKFK